jgi:hypothetical protein
MSKSELTFFGLLRQNVTFKRMLSFNFTRTRQLKAFLGTGFCFLLGHCSFNLNYFALYKKGPNVTELFLFGGNEHCHAFPF